MASSTWRAVEHPIFCDLVRGLQEREGDGYVATPEHLGGIQRRALAITDGQELYDLLDTLVGFAGFLAQKGAKKTATDLLHSLEPLAAHLESLARQAQHLSHKSDDLRKRLERDKLALSSQGSTQGAMASKNAGGVSLRGKRRGRGK